MSEEGRGGGNEGGGRVYTERGVMVEGGGGVMREGKGDIRMGVQWWKGHLVRC